MAKLIGSAQSTNFGENLFIRKAQEFLDDQYIIYWNRQIYGREFDVCILMPGKGILVVELKGWREENILRIENSDTIIIKTNEGETLATPQKQARGYRFAIERHIRQNTGKFPLVFQMVCLPQVSKDFYHRKRLDVVLDESFTILKEDLEDTSSFYKKIDQALSEAFRWKRDPFDSKTMLEVRNLYETDIDLDKDDESEIGKGQVHSYHQHDYSRFYYFSEADELNGNGIEDIKVQYMCGCKLYCVFSKKEQMIFVLNALDVALTQKGLVRNRDNIEIAFDEQKNHIPPATSVNDMAAGWDIEATLPGSIPQKHLLYNPATLLKALYPSVKKAMTADTQEAAKVVGKLEEYIGELNQKNLIDTLSAIQELFSVFSANGIIGSTELRVKYEKPPIETGKTVMGHIKLINDAASAQAVKQLTAYSGNSLHVLYDLLRMSETFVSIENNGDMLVL